ncbi:hypothetical protein FE789_14630 [Burkholderia pseudomallei]|nr:hypothetical protein FE789_14630 [Burkholderia pseudomallei]
MWRESTVPASESWELKMQMQLELLDAEHKKRLLMAGVSKEMILGLLRCCRTRDCQGQGCFDCSNRRDQSTCNI